jgi:hypothetical protein
MSNTDMIKLIYARKGLRGFSDGILARCVKIGFGQLIIMSVFTKMMDVLQN